MRAGGGTGAAYVYEATTGAPIADYLLTPDAPRFINDNVLTKDAVYFTDSQRPWLYRLPVGVHGSLPSATEIRTVPLSGDYVHVDGVNNLNGIVATPNGKALIAVQSSTASLLRIDPDTGVMVFTRARLDEISFVLHGAVPGAEVLEVRADLGVAAALAVLERRGLGPTRLDAHEVRAALALVRERGL